MPYAILRYTPDSLEGNMASNVRKKPGYKEIIDIIRQWEPAQRLTLVEEVLTTLAQDERASKRPPNVEQALGLLATDQTPPSDADIERWLDERHVSRYDA
jgi:hypothetical protein